MSTIKPLDKSQIEPYTAIKQSELKRIKDNFDGLKDLIYGNRPTLGSGAHNHSQMGGENLKWIPIATLSYGPYAEESDTYTDVLPGIPLYAPSGINDFTVVPKLLASCHIRIPAGISEIYVLHCVVSSSGSSFTFGNSIRNPSKYGYLNGFEDANRDLSMVPSGRTIMIDEVLIDDLSVLGEPSLTRDAIFEVWLKSNPPGNVFDRLIGSFIYAFSSVGNAEGAIYKTSIEEPKLIPSDISANSPITDSMVQGQLQNKSNHIVFNAIGKCPGIHFDMVNADRNFPYQTTISNKHKHRGIYDDGLGNLIYDGNLFDNQIGHHVSHSRLGKGAGSVYNASTYNGRLIDGIIFRKRLSIPFGASYIEVVFGLLCENESQIANCNLYPSLKAIGDGTELIKSIYTDGWSMEGDVLKIKVSPIQSIQYKSNANSAILHNRQWSRLMLLPQDQMPDNVIHENWAIRISKPVYLYLGNSLFDSNVSARTAREFELALRWEIELELSQVTEGYATDNKARLQFYSIYLPKGE